MAKILRDLLDAEEPIFSLALRQLERASGEQGRDAHLIGDIVVKMSKAIRLLGLDPNDTTGRELYAAQLARIEQDNARLAKLLGGEDADDVDEMTPRIIEAVKELNISRTCWVLKRAAAKKLLKRMPPKRLMQHLGYRSVDSLLKHEPVDELFAALRFSEGAAWLDAFNELFASVQPSDFESRDVSLVVIDRAKYIDLAERFIERKLHNVVHSKEMGVVALLPVVDGYLKAVTLTDTVLTLHYLNEVRLYSTFFKLKQVAPNFGQVIVNTLKTDTTTVSQMAGQYVHWRIIQHYFGQTDDSDTHLAVFQPHIQPEDLSWRETAVMLTMIDPELSFWEGLDYVGRLYDGQPLSFNILDLSLSCANHQPYERAYVNHFRQSLWNEIFTRYMGAQNLAEQVLGRLDDGMIAPEDVTA